DGETAALELAKLARLLPAVFAAPLPASRMAWLGDWAARENLLAVDGEDCLAYRRIAARALQPVAVADIPLEGAAACRVHAFRPGDGSLEHLALVIGQVDPDPAPDSAPDSGEAAVGGSGAAPVLIRLHSECFTGDLLGSLRCDCGQQLRGAIDEIARAGSGILLYLAQEGRGIGLINKLRAYALQDAGHDTFDANEALGFEADERLFLPAATMLRRLGVGRVRLMTNNPEKVAALRRFGVDVVERVAHAFPSNGHNEAYLKAKAGRGHLLDV
ncbi:MAG: GTP cyclohydrolase II, partial [Alphaproteobacteria bacterium]